MPKYIPADEEAVFEVKLKGIKEDATEATFDIERTSDACEILETITGSIEGTTCTAKWMAQGPDPAADKRSWRVKYKVTVPGKNGQDIEKVSEELEVYNSWMEISAVNAEDDSPVKDAPYEIKIGKKVIKGDTGSTGTFKQMALPAGEVKWIKWKEWAVLKEWVDETGTTRKAKIEVCKKAKIVSPKPKKKKPHKQYVNLAEDASKPNQGQKIKIQVELEEGKAGDKVYLKTEFDSTTKRNDVTRSVVGGSSEAWNSPDGGKMATLSADGEKVEFEVELGYEGGSTCTIKVGGNNKCEDDSLTIVNWRKLYYQLTRPKDVKNPKMKRIEKALKDVFIEYERYKIVTVSQSTTRDAPTGSWVPASWFGGKKNKKMLNVGDYNKPYWHGKFADTKTPLGVHVCYCHVQFDQDAADNTKDLALSGGDALDSGDTIKWKDGKTVYGYKWAIDGTYETFPKVMKDDSDALKSGSWSEVGGAGTGNLSMDNIWIDPVKHSSTVHIKLPDDAGEVLKKGGKVTLTVQVVVASGPFMGEADGTDGWKQLIAARARAGGKATANSTVNDVMAHELGHTMNQVVESGSEPPGTTAGDHGRQYTGNEHSGSHCADGMSSANYAGGTGKVGSAYENDFSGSSECTCIMYGENDPDGSGSDGEFCNRCQPFIKAEKLDTLH